MVVSLALVSTSTLAQGNWVVTNAGVGPFAHWAAATGVTLPNGDFDDIAQIRWTFGWATLPLSLAKD